MSPTPNPSDARTLPAMFKARAELTPDAVAYSHRPELVPATPSLDEPTHGPWTDITWREALEQAARWQAAMRREGLSPGDRVAVMLPNSPAWVFFDMAAMGLGLVTVPLYARDRAENFAYALEQTRAKLLVIDGLERWQRIEELRPSDDGGPRLPDLARIVVLKPICDRECDRRVREVDDWLPEAASEFTTPGDEGPDRSSASGELATIVYTSGSTGRPKGVMLSHENILANCKAGLAQVPATVADVFLSVLPLSHVLERTVGYYIPVMAGARVGFARSPRALLEDFRHVRPTVFITVPRLFERVHAGARAKLSEKPAWLQAILDDGLDACWRRFLARQGRAESPGARTRFLCLVVNALLGRRVRAGLGGRLRVAVCGGAPLSPEISRFFLALGVTIVQGYGLTEHSPVISVNTAEDNHPETVGPPLPGVQVRLGEDGELQAKSASVMLGYWKNPEASARAITPDGWLRTGDQAVIDDAGLIRIVGRLKDILVLSNGEKIPPEDMEVAIQLDPLIDQVLIAGEGRPHLVALAVLNNDQWRREADRLNLNSEDSAALASKTAENFVLARIRDRLAHFPGYATVRRARLTLHPWTAADQLLTATLKPRRSKILEKFAKDVEELYELKKENGSGGQRSL